MNTIQTIAHTEYVIQKSKFITLLFPVTTEKEILVKLEETKQTYKGATHYCYAYIIDNLKRFSDDGEPSGTAGIPILHVLEEKECNHILAIVVRYFGGIKLGAGGLVRAYTSATTEAFNKAKLEKEIIGNKVKIIFSYNHIKKIDYILKNYPIIKKEYHKDITYIFMIPKEEYKQILDQLTPWYNEFALIEENIYI